MTRLISLFILILAIVASACTPSATPTVTVAPVPATPAFVQTTTGSPSVGETEFDAARAFDHNRKLSVEIGKRVAGTAGSQAATDYIASEFQKSGLEVTKQPFEFEFWEDRGTAVEMLAPESEKIDAQLMTYSAGGKVEGDLVAVPGLGSRDDFSKVNVRGKIALVKRGTLTFGTKALNAQEAGAAAILVYNDRPQNFSGVLREKVTIPTLSLSGATGENLLDLLQRGSARVRIESDSGLTKSTGYNVIGTLKGKSDETIVLGGHYDSVAAGPGAVDNGSGTATLLELARVLARRGQPEHTMVFIAFDAEEEGLLGSAAYVKGLSNEQIAKIRAMLNFDMLGGGGGPLILLGDGNAALLARSSAQQLGIQAHNGQLPNGAGSDHQSFAQRGVDTVFFMRNYDLLHTPDDTIDQVREEYLGEAGRVAERLVERLDAQRMGNDSSSLAPTQ